MEIPILRLLSNTWAVLNRVSSSAITVNVGEFSPGQFPSETCFTCSHQYCFIQRGADACG